MYCCNNCKNNNDFLLLSSKGNTKGIASGLLFLPECFVLYILYLSRECESSLPPLTKGTVADVRHFTDAGWDGLGRSVGGTVTVETSWPTLNGRFSSSSTSCEVGHEVSWRDEGRRSNWKWLQQRFTSKKFLLKASQRLCENYIFIFFFG